MCVQCHEEIRGSGGPHNEKHFEREFVCVKCHEGIGHDPVKSKQLPSREICSQCHG
ncbi:MAG: hypothetical protein H0Z35_11015 [Thermoanaerobacteraceae bacterium]|nr:hypothetical protein [Thermoanaerobacteraceae bacterium]